MRGSTAYNKTVVFKDNFFREAYWQLYKFKSNQPYEIVSDSESVQSEVIATEKTSPTPKSPLPFDLSLLFSDPRFSEGLQQQIAMAFSSHLSTLTIEPGSSLLTHSANPEASHSGDPGLNVNINQEMNRSLAGNIKYLKLQLLLLFPLFPPTPRGY